METQTYRSKSSWFLHHLDPILRSNFSCRSRSTVKPILAVTDPPRIVHHVQPKSKEGFIESRGARPTTSRSILCEDPSNVNDVDLNTTNHEVTDHES